MELLPSTRVRDARESTGQAASPQMSHELGTGLPELS
jgi:hypothetical protein